MPIRLVTSPLAGLLLLLCFISAAHAQPTGFGSGMNNKVEALCFVEGPAPLGGLYAAGSFTTADGLNRQHIARWDGTTWRNVGGGTNGPVKALIVYKNQLYVGGKFTKAGNVNVKNIARWDGTTWRKVGKGVNGTVFAFGIQGNALIVGGKFSQAGNVNANNVARLNNSTWSKMHNGMNGPVYALVTFNGKIHAGGAFTQASGASANRLARWNGTKWVPLKQNPALRNEFGLENGVNGAVFAMATDGFSLFIGGAFTTAGGKTVGFIVGWNGSGWFALGIGTNGSVRTIVVMFPGVIAVGGTFTTAGGVVSRRAAVFWIDSWIAQPAFNAVVLAMLFREGHIIAGGAFTRFDGTPFFYIAKFIP